MLLVAPEHEQLHIQHYGLLRVLLPPAGLVFFIGLLDDVLNLSATAKLLGQVIACLMAAVLGHIYAPESFTFGSSSSVFSQPWASVMICTFWLVVCTNAINLIDGLDGLAAGVGLMGALATLAVGLYQHNLGLVIATVPLAGALLAFLFYNFNPASIFLGDCGSLTIGFMLGAISLTWQHHGGITLGMFAPVSILALPLLDVCIAIARRYLRRKPLFAADRGHIHHVMQDRGHKPRAAALILYTACAIAACLSVLASVIPRGFHMLLIATFSMLLIVALRYLDYIEFRAASSVFSSKRIRQQVGEEIYLCELEIALSKMETADDCWDLVKTACQKLDFATAEMFFRNHYYDAVLQEDVDERDWWLTLPVGERGYLRVSRSNLLGGGSVVMPALDRLQRGLDKWDRTASPDKTLQHAA
jgi:UDP-GlcNAc:undecaprenyl-phosphate GlcNAc-1-phosphate transferase